MRLRQYTKNNEEFNLYTLYERLIRKAMSKERYVKDQAALLGVSIRTMTRLRTEIKTEDKKLESNKRVKTNKYGI